MEKDFSVRGALKRLKSITVLDIRNMKTKDLEAISAFCAQFAHPLGDELARRSLESKQVVLANAQ